MKNLLAALLLMLFCSCGVSRTEEQIAQGVIKVVDGCNMGIYKVSVDSSEYIVVSGSRGYAICKHK